VVGQARYKHYTFLNFKEELQMKAVYLTGYGRSIENLECRDVADPGAPGPGEALIAVEYAPINFNDLMVVWGTFPWKPETPAVIGNEGSGVVEAIGEGVTAVKVGDRVVLPLTAGSWRQRLVIAADTLVSVSTEADPQQVSMLGINPPTASLLLTEYVELQPGDAIVYNAANSGLARWIVALARKKKLKTIGLIRRSADVAKVASEGCDIVIVDDEPIAEAQKRIAGLNVKLGLDVVGGSAAGRVLEFISPGGKFVNYGSVTEKPLELLGATLTFKQISVEAFFQGAPEMALRATSRIPELSEMLVSERIEQPVAAIYTLDRIREAAEHAAKGSRILLDIKGTH
jgi:NADPH:quinone reductase-like Zn-dependent oxidoreductase